MKSVVFDSYALIAYFKNEEGALEIVDLLTQLSMGEIQGFISVINVGEIYYMLCRKVNKTRAEQAMDLIKILPIEISSIDYNSSYQAAKLKSKYKISFADAFAASLSIEKKAVLITGDPEFKQLSTEKNFQVKFIRKI
ncbi:MAG: type II toxin-antitoxin system VapC family toxin [Cyclobacteriaceae bacterium]|nr:type II toxin-antitoxin system VapC family toxin [Cyclobacteriaceae bacterium]